MKRILFLLFLLCAVKFTALAETKLYVTEAEFSRDFAENIIVFDSPMEEYGKVSRSDEKDRLFNVYLRLKDNAEAKCVFWMYFEPQTSRKSINSRLKFIVTYLVKKRGIEANRLLFSISDDNRERTTVVPFIDEPRFPKDSKELITGESLAQKLGLTETSKKN